MIRLLLVVDQRLARDGLRLLIEGQPDMTVVGEAAGSDEAVAWARESHPEVILLDIDTPGVDCLETTGRIRCFLPEVRVVALSSNCSDEKIARALEAQILGFALKEEGFSELRDAIRDAAKGEYRYTRRVMDRVVTENGKIEPRQDAKTRYHLLTPRERQLLRLLASGMSLKDACRSLHVSYKTADKHKVNLMKKLDIHDRVELARYAIREKIIDP